MAEHWMEIALVDYCFKVLISIVFFLPMYGVLLNMLLKRLADKSEINALQHELKVRYQSCDKMDE